MIVQVIIIKLVLKQGRVQSFFFIYLNPFLFAYLLLFSKFDQSCNLFLDIR